MDEPLVLIPGLMADARVFMPQLVRLGADRQMQVALATKGETVEQMSEAILTGLPEKFALLGHGLGGDIALDLIRRAPDRVTRVVLMATDPLSEPPQAAAARETRIVAARSGRLALLAADRRESVRRHGSLRSARSAHPPCARRGCASLSNS